MTFTQCFVPDSARLPGVNSFKDTNKVVINLRIPCKHECPLLAYFLPRYPAAHSELGRFCRGAYLPFVGISL
jgi:hypothetical protein